MAATEQVRRADDPLTVDDVDGLELPESYCTHTGNLVVRTPTSTVQWFSSGDDPVGPYFESVRPHHFDADSDDLRNSHLLPDKVSLKKYGEDAEVFAVDV